jgi:hypothetical protein
LQSMRLTASERRQLIRLLGLLQVHLTSDIDGIRGTLSSLELLMPGVTSINDLGLREEQENLALADQWIKWLERRPPIIEAQPGTANVKPKARKRPAGGKGK